jgi:hypothetical protein
MYSKTVPAQGFLMVILVQFSPLVVYKKYLNDGDHFSL